MFDNKQVSEGKFRVLYSGVWFLEDDCAFVETGCAFLEPGCRFAELNCAFLEVYCAFVESGCAFLEVNCTFEERRCAFLEPDFGFGEVDCAFLECKFEFDLYGFTFFKQKNQKLSFFCGKIFYICSPYTEIIAQLVRASDCGSEGRGFETRCSPKNESLVNEYLQDFFVQHIVCSIPECLIWFLFYLPA